MCTSSNVLINKSFVILTFIVASRLILRFFSETIIPPQREENELLTTIKEDGHEI